MAKNNSAKFIAFTNDPKAIGDAVVVLPGRINFYESTIDTKLYCLYEIRGKEISKTSYYCEGDVFLTKRLNPKSREYREALKIAVL